MLLLAPAPFEPAGTNPDAWDEIPTTSLGETWTLSFALWLPVGAVASVRAVLFTGPYANAGTPRRNTPLIVNGAAMWQPLSVSYLVEQDVTRWVGIEITYFPAGPAWNDVPPTLLWNDVNPSLTWDDFGDNCTWDDLHGNVA